MDTPPQIALHLKCRAVPSSVLPPREPLSQMFWSIAERMRLDFQGSGEQLEHRGLRGQAREQSLVREYLHRYLPGNVEVRQNVEIVASDGQNSGETDIALCGQNTRPLWLVQEVEVLPIECVFGVIEVRSHLDRRGLGDLWDKIVGIKRFPRKAFLPPLGPKPYRWVQYGKDWDHFPPLGFVFAFDSIDLALLADEMVERARGCEPEHRVDAVWVLEKGAVVWLNEDNTWLAPQPGPLGIRIAETGRTMTPLPLMTMQLQGLLQSAFVEPFRIGSYMGNLPLGVVKEWREATEAPPTE